jgi:hypothetical protein
MMQSLAEWAQARTDLLLEAANAHTGATTAHEARLQAQVEAAQEVQRVKDTMAHQSQKEAADLKKKLEDAEQKAKDAAANLQAMIEGEPLTLPHADSECFGRSRYGVFHLESL